MTRGAERVQDPDLSHAEPQPEQGAGAMLQPDTRALVPASSWAQLGEDEGLSASLGYVWGKPQ